jgi:hypothetical protein
MKTIKDYFNTLEQKVVGIVEMIDGVEVMSYSARYNIVRYFGVIKRFIRAQQNLENQRDLWNETVNFLNASKAFDNEVKEEIRKELLTDCFEQLRKLNKKIIRLQLQTQKNTTVEGNAEKANKPDTTVEGNAEKANKPDEKFNWQGKQAQLVYLIEQLYEKGFLSPILQPDKHRLTAQHFTVKGESLNTGNLANTKRNNLNNKSGKPRDGEKIDEIISATQKQNP